MFGQAHMATLESMTIRARKSADRGHADHGWLDSHHTFSFANYVDPEHMGFRSIRVINDDRVVGGAGFPTHPHRSMEILSYVVDGALEHSDSMGTGSVIRPGEVQRMSAGSGVTHSEYNHDAEQTVRFLQIWILPEEQGGEPGYEQKDFADERVGKLRLVASRDGREGSVTVRQDVAMYASVLGAGESVTHTLEAGRHAWLQVVRGELRLADQALAEGDGAAVDASTESRKLTVEAAGACEFILFDLA